MTPPEIKQQVREELMDMQVQINSHREGDAFIREYTLNDAQLDSIIDHTVQMTEERIVEEMKSWTNQNHSRSTEPLYAWVDAKDLINKLSLITNKSEINK